MNKLMISTKIAESVIILHQNICILNFLCKQTLKHLTFDNQKK